MTKSSRQSSKFQKSQSENFCFFSKSVQTMKATHHNPQNSLLWCQTQPKVPLHVLIGGQSCFGSTKRNYTILGSWFHIVVGWCSPKSLIFFQWSPENTSSMSKKKSPLLILNQKFQCRLSKKFLTTFYWGWEPVHWHSTMRHWNNLTTMAP